MANTAEPLNIRLAGPEFEPTDPRWRLAGHAERLAYFRKLGEIALEVKKAEIRRGISRTGRKLKPVKMQYRKDGATGPPLIPHVDESRTIRLLAAHAMVTGVTLFWRPDAGRSWRRILGYHAYKHGPRSLPVRNTIGITPKGQQTIARRAKAEWDAQQGELFMPPAPEPGPPPLPGLRPTPAAPAPVPLPGQAARPGLVRPAPVKPPTLPDVERHLGMKFVPTHAAKVHRDVTVIVDVAKVEASLMAERAFHVGPLGTGAAIPGRYAGVRAFFAKARKTFGKAKEILVEIGRAALNALGNVHIRDGRHRFAVLRDQGAKAVPMSVPRSDAAEFRAKFGVTEPVPLERLPTLAPLTGPQPVVRGRVIYLPKGMKPDPLSRKIQVYES
jgi:hypothetical protein